MFEKKQPKTVPNSPKQLNKCSKRPGRNAVGHVTAGNGTACLKFTCASHNPPRVGSRCVSLAPDHPWSSQIIPSHPRSSPIISDHLRSSPISLIIPKHPGTSQIIPDHPHLSPIILDFDPFGEHCGLVLVPRGAPWAPCALGPIWGIQGGQSAA